MKTAFLFPGQGSQFVGMGRDLYESSAAARAIFDEANEVLGFSLTDIMFGTGGDPEAEADVLRQTQNTQPALYVHSVAAWAALGATASFDAAAGHSLGEYSALAAAGAFSFADGLRAVRLRGELMAEAGTRRPGTMAAVIGMEDAALEAICQQASASGVGIVQPANFNSPGQIVISGDVPAVLHAMTRAQEAGAMKVVQLSVSGAFHSPLMEYAVEGLAAGLQNMTMQAPHVPVFLNVTAAPKHDPDFIRTPLLAQLTAAVRWAHILNNMHEAGIERYVEVGAGSVLSGLVKRTVGRKAHTTQIGTTDQVNKWLEA